MRVLLIFLVVVLPVGVAMAQTVRFVDADATGAGTGSSWADAFVHLQDALAVAEAGDEVWVAEGTYRPTDGTDRDASFVLPSGARLYGGFDGTETDRNERDWEAHPTVLSGDIGAPGDFSDNAFHVVTASGVDGSTLLDGFTVTGGYGNGANPRNRGAGIYGVDASLVVRDCRVVENRVVQTDGFGGGGGAFFEGVGALRFERVVFERNGVNALGGGLWLRGNVEAGAVPVMAVTAEAEARRNDEAFVRESREAVTGGTSSEYTPDGYALGLRADALSAVFRDVAFVENTGSFGGAMNAEGATVEVVGGTFLRNFASDGTGGLRISLTSADLINVGFYGNEVDPEVVVGAAGGMRSSGGSTYALTNVLFVGNVARIGGALAHGGGGTGALTNVTFASNEADEGGALALASGATAAVRNGVLWSNDDEIDAGSGNLELRYSLLVGGCPPDGSGEAECEALLNADPLFVRAPDAGPDGAWGTGDDDYGDLRLREGSPAVDFGLTSFLPPDTFDLDDDGDTAELLPHDLAGEARVQGAAVDLGAYEHPGPVAAEPAAQGSTLSLDAYPNPARGPVTVSFDLVRTQRAEVALFDVRGRRVAVLHEGPLAAGRHALRLDTATLPSGIYLLRLRSATASLTRRVVVLR